MTNNYDLVVVDTDTPLFSAAAVSEQRAILVTHEPTGIQKRFKTRTEFKELMKSKNKPITEAYSIQDLQEPESVENALHLVKSSMQKIIDIHPSSKVVFVAGDSNNFRLDLPLPTRYKSQRADMLRPVHLKACHKYARQRFGAISADGYEADDLTAILAYDAIEVGNTALLLSVDKDAAQFTGLTLSDHAGSYYKYVSEMHDVSLVKGKFKSYGIPWIAYQWCCGDVSDGWKPTELSGCRYGDASAYKDFKDLKTPQEVLLKVIELYKQFYPEKFEYTDWKGQQHDADWKSVLALYFQCCKMKESYDDDLCAGKFLAKYGVDL